MERESLGFSLSFAPRRYQRRTSGRDQARAPPVTTLPTSIGPPSSCPLVTCDLVSHESTRVAHRPQHRTRSYPRFDRRTEQQTARGPGRELPRRARPQAADTGSSSPAQGLQRISEHRPPRHQRAGLRVKAMQQPGEPPPHVLSAHTEAPKPPPHRARRTPQHCSDPPMSQPCGFGEQRRTDHRHAIPAPREPRRGQQHMGLRATRAARPARPMPHAAFLPAGRAPTGMAPRPQHPCTRRARQPTHKQPGLDHNRVVIYHEHRVPPSTK